MSATPPTPPTTPRTKIAQEIGALREKEGHAVQEVYKAAERIQQISSQLEQIPADPQSSQTIQRSELHLEAGLCGELGTEYDKLHDIFIRMMGLKTFAYYKAGGTVEQLARVVTKTPEEQKEFLEKAAPSFERWKNEYSKLLP